MTVALKERAKLQSSVCLRHCRSRERLVGRAGLEPATRPLWALG